MTRRMIDASLWQNEKFTRMPLGAQMLQIGIITHADDQGRVKANPSFLRNQIFPDNEDITNADIQKWLGLMVKNGTILVYSADEKQYAQLLNWWKYQSLQYASPSQFPRPDGWKDRIRKTVTKGFIATCNWLTVDGTLLADTCDQDGNPLPKKPMPKTVKPTPPPSFSPNGTQPHHLNEKSAPPDDSPESSPESSPEPTTKLNRIELNRTKSSYAREADTEPIAQAAAALPETDEGYAEFVKEYQAKWAMLPNEYHAEKIHAWCDRVPIEAWVYALRECADSRKVGNWKYFERILERVEQEGVPETAKEKAVSQKISGKTEFSLGGLFQ